MATTNFMRDLKAKMTFIGQGKPLPGNTNNTFSNNQLKRALTYSDLYVGTCADGRALWALIGDPSRFAFGTPKSDFEKGKVAIVAFIDADGKWQRESWAPKTASNVLASGIVG